MPIPTRAIDLAQILSILRAIAGRVDCRAVIGAVSTEIRAILPHDHLDVALLSVDGACVVAYETGLHTEWDAGTTATKPVESSPIRDLLFGRVDAILTDDAQSDPRFQFAGAFSQPIFSAKLRSRLHVSLKVEGRVCGALSFSTQAFATYQPGDVGNAQVVADILAPYFHSLQQSERVKQGELQKIEGEARAEGLRVGALHLTDELENARQAIGMDLHDQTLADLTRIARNVKRLAGKRSVVAGELQSVQEDIEHCVRELRVIIDNAKPSVLQFFGFGQAVEALLERSARLVSPPLDYRLIDDGSLAIDALPPNTVVALYRIVQESINNTVRHASASIIRVHLGQIGGRIHIVVEDNGRGLPKSAGRRSGGLANIRTRASLIQAELTSTSGADGKGTRVEIVLPVPKAAAQRQERGRA